MYILYKICLKEERNNRVLNKRPFIKNVQEMAAICLLSLIKQIDENDKLILFLDGEDKNNIINKLCKQHNINYSIIQDNKGCWLTSKESIDYIFQNITKKDEIIYFCEDDYLHYNNCIDQIKDFLDTYPDYVCHPTDYPNLYNNLINDPSEIVITKNHHWRSVKTSTFTFAFKRSLLDFWINDLLFKNMSSPMFYAHVWNLVYVFRKCFSPIPSLTSHIETGCLPPCINTKQEYELLKECIQEYQLQI